MPSTSPTPDSLVPDRDTEPNRGLSRCWQNQGWHVYMAGPCFDTKDEAVRYRDYLDAKGITWESSRA